MKKFHNQLVVIFSVALYFIAWVLLHPYLGFRLDSDCTAYLSIAEHVASGDFSRSVNGLWSPLNGWLLVPFIKMGINSWEAAKCINAFIGGAVLIMMYLLFSRKKIHPLIFKIVMLVLPVILVYYAYLQVFGDLLQVFFLLVYFYCITSKKFFTSYFYLIVSSIAIVLAYYAKAYSFVFFVLHFSSVLFILVKQNHISKRGAIQKFILSISIIVLCILPWTFALHKKYNTWSLTGNAGKLNMSWNIMSGKEFKKEITLLIPPTYSDAVSFWEDPMPSQGNLYSPTSSLQHFVKWIARVVYTCLQAILCFNEISWLCLAFLFFSLFYHFKYKKDETDVQIAMLAISILPLGYLAMHIETRYVWFATFMFLYIGTNFLNQFLYKENIFSKGLKSYVKVGIVCLFFVSFITFPIYNIKELKGANKQIFETSSEYKLDNAFTSNAVDAGNMWVLAYLQKQSYYTIEQTNYTLQDVIVDMKRYGIKQYIHTFENSNPTMDTTFFLEKYEYKNGSKLYELKN
jgi:hypothetical protein